MKKQNLELKLRLSKKVISNLQSDAVKGGGTQICGNTNLSEDCPLRPTKFCNQ